MKKSVIISLLLLASIPLSQAAYKFTAEDKACENSANGRLDLLGHCEQSSIDRLEKKIKKTGKVSPQKLILLKKQFKKQCIKEEIKNESIDGPDYDEYGAYYVNGCIRDKLYKLIH